MTRFLSLLLIISIPVFGQKFIVFGDTQFHNPEIFSQMIQKGMNCNPEIVLHVGDMILGYKYPASAGKREWEVFRKQIKSITVPFYAAPGNHDITTPGLREAYLDEWGEGSLFYRVEYSGLNFIFLNSTNGEKTDSVTEDQFQWLKSTLDTIGKTNPAFITLHAPLQFTNTASWKRFREVIQGYNVEAVFTGHYHVYDRRVIDGVNYFCLVTSGKIPYDQHYAGRSFHFLEVEKVDEGFHYRVHLKDTVLIEETVPPGEHNISAKFAPKTFCIDVPEDHAGWLDFSIPFTNRTASIQTFRVTSVPIVQDNLELKQESVMLLPDSEGMIRGRLLVKDLNSFNVAEVLGEISTSYTNGFGHRGEIIAPLLAYTPPRCEVLPKKEHYVFDGEVSATEYGGIAISTFRSDFHNTPSPDSTIIFFTYDSDSLYIGFWGYEPNPEGMEAFAHGEIPLVFSDDDIEFYFAPGRLQQSYRTMVNSKGTNLNSGPKGLFSFPSDSKVHIGDNYWSAEFRIPFSSFSAPVPVSGATWGFNIRRTRTQSRIRLSDWSKMSDTPPVELHFFGIAEFK